MLKSNENFGVPDSLKGEHLTNPCYKIIGCLHYAKKMDERSRIFVNSFREYAELVDYYYSTEEICLKNILGRQDSYVISSCNSDDKYSYNFHNCTGIAVLGEKPTGRQISFLTHQNPKLFLTSHKDDLKRNLNIRLDEIIRLSKKGSIDAVIFGGNKQDDYSEYLNPITLLSKIIYDKLFFYPVVLTGPNIVPRLPTDVYLETQERRIHIIRLLQRSGNKLRQTNDPYTFPQIMVNMRKWK